MALSATCYLAGVDSRFFSSRQLFSLFTSLPKLTFQRFDVFPPCLTAAGGYYQVPVSLLSRWARTEATP